MDITITIPDLDTITDPAAVLADIDAKIGEAWAQRARIEAIARAPQRIVDLQEQTLAALDRQRGTAWARPTGAHDAYPLGWTVTHSDKEWISTRASNVWEPGTQDSGWVEKVDPETEPTVAAWVQPLGAQDAYALDAQVAHSGRLWQSSVADNVWEPGVYGWDDLGVI